MTSNAWFAIDKDGFSKLVAEQKPMAMVEVAFSNPLDQNVKNVRIMLEPLAQGAKHDPATGTGGFLNATAGTLGAAPYLMVVEDDDPDGFTELSHAWTVFGESGKKADATKRGRFNLGEKLLLSLCTEATIQSTTGTVRFRPDGKRTQTAACTEQGTTVTATIPLTAAEVAEWERLVRTVLIPKNVKVFYNGDQLPAREVHKSFTVKGLDTVLGEELRHTKRNAKVELVKPLDGDTPFVFELGIPVVESDMPYHVNVLQKVPLSFNRDNLPPAYLRRLRTEVLNNMYDEITPDTANSTWVRDALPKADPAAITQVIVSRFGEDAVAFDPGDREASREAQSIGLNVVGGRALSGEEWAAVRSVPGLLLPAGQVTPSPKVQIDDLLSAPPIDQANWTAGMQRVADYSKQVIKAVLGADATILFHNQSRMSALAYWQGHATLGFNVGRLGKAWFNSPDQVAVDALLIHEMAHQRVADHLSHDFYTECCRIGALLRAKAGTLQV